MQNRSDPFPSEQANRSIFTNDIFFLVKDTEIYNDVCDHELENGVSKLELDSQQFYKWFEDIITKINAEKCYFLNLEKKPEMCRLK